MYRTAITVLSLAISIGCMFAVVIAANWFVQEVATVSVSGQRIPLSAFPKTELDKPQGGPGCSNLRLQEAQQPGLDLWFRLAERNSQTRSDGNASGTMNKT